MKVTYIQHSGFSVELNDVVLVFDYYKGTIPEFAKEKQIIVFSSHKHHDHFCLDIFSLAKKYENITYVLSKDTRMSDNYMVNHEIPLELKDNIIYVQKNSTTELNLLSGKKMNIETLTSTDEGVAFLLTLSHEIEPEEKQVIYHAGDLNWWSWQGESQEEYEEMTSRFLAEMKKLEGKEIGVAFVPLDPRQEDRFWWGFDCFMKTTRTSKVFPMHCWEDYSVIEKLKDKDCSEEYRDAIVTITKPGEEFYL